MNGSGRMVYMDKSKALLIIIGVIMRAVCVYS